MILPDFKVFPKQGRIIGIDWGLRRVGIAISDAAREMVFVRPVVDGKNAMSAIKQMVADDNVVGLVMGLPLYSDGTDSDTTKMVRDFANDLAKSVDVPIAFVDETLSSMSAQESLGRVRVYDIKTKLDSESARVILENAISMINRQS